MSLFRWVAHTKLRLTIACVIGLGLVFGAARPLTNYIRYESASPVGDMLLLTALAFTMLATAAWLGVLVGDAVFPGRWRQRVILGLDVEVNVPEDSLEAVKSLKSYYVHFSLLVVGFILASIWSFNALTDNFFAEFQRFGRIRSTLRSDDVKSKLTVLDELSGWRRDDEVPGALEILDMVWRDDRQPDEVRRASLETLGQLGVYLASAVDQWRLENRNRSWQGDLLVELRRELAPDLRAALPEAPPAMRPGVIFALGAIRDTRALPLVLDELKAFPDETSAQWRAAAIALGRLRAPSSLRDVAELVTARPTHDGEAPVILGWVVRDVVHAYYVALGDDEPSAEDRAAIGALVTYYGALINGADEGTRCLAAVVLKYLRDVRARPQIFAAFDKPGTGAVVCGADRFSAEGTSSIYLSDSGEPLRQRLINALAPVAVGDDVVVQWVRGRRRAGSDDSKFITALLTDLLKQVEAANRQR